MTRHREGAVVFNLEIFDGNKRAASFRHIYCPFPG
jgi:hypothetical protein